MKCKWCNEENNRDKDDECTTCFEMRTCMLADFDVAENMLHYLRTGVKKETTKRFLNLGYNCIDFDTIIAVDQLSKDRTHKDPDGGDIMETDHYIIVATERKEYEFLVHESITDKLYDKLVGMLGAKRFEIGLMWDSIWTYSE